MKTPRKITVFATLRFEAWHCWPEAPKRVKYLSSMHRHMFHVKLEKTVSHDRRQIEFITMKQEAQAYIESLKKLTESGVWSCEKWASELIERLNLNACEVSEDGENGARVERHAAEDRAAHMAGYGSLAHDRCSRPHGQSDTRPVPDGFFKVSLDRN